MEMMIEREESDASGSLALREQADRILQTCLEIFHGSDDSGQSLQTLLGFLGEKTGSDRVYILERTEPDNRVSNTCEWCRPGVSPQKELLRAFPKGIQSRSFMPWPRTRALF